MVTVHFEQASFIVLAYTVQVTKAVLYIQVQTSPKIGFYPQISRMKTLDWITLVLNPNIQDIISQISPHLDPICHSQCLLNS